MAGGAIALISGRSRGCRTVSGSVAGCGHGWRGEGEGEGEGEGASTI